MSVRHFGPSSLIEVPGRASMHKLIASTLNRLRRLRLKTAGSSDPHRDLTSAERATCEAVALYTMTSVERIVALIQATRYIVENEIPGAFVECGVWRGGSMMAVARTLLELGCPKRNLFLYDTYRGMSAPTDRDRTFDGRGANELLVKSGQSSGAADVRCYADLADVTRNLLSTGYSRDNIQFIEGKVEDTLPAVLPGPTALLRLDTDWYESTRHELIHLYPLLTSKGVLIIDDYGHWRGAKTATDEYFSAHAFKPFLMRADYTGRLLVKP